MAPELHSRPVYGDCQIIAPEYAYLACKYRATALMQESFFESQAEETLVLTHDSTKLNMNGAELGFFREQQRRNTSPTKGGSGSGSPHKRNRAQEDDVSFSHKSFDHDSVRASIYLSSIADGGVRFILSRLLGWSSVKGGSCSKNIRLLSHDGKGKFVGAVLSSCSGETIRIHLNNAAIGDTRKPGRGLIAALSSST
jgi:hypothetical protein